MIKSHGGSDVAVGVTQLLSQTLCQGSHGELGAAVEMCISAVNHAMSAHAATQEHEWVVGEVNTGQHQRLPTTMF